MGRRQCRVSSGPRLRKVSGRGPGVWWGWGAGEGVSHGATRGTLPNTLEFCATPLGQNKLLKWGPEPQRHKTSPPIFADHLHEVTRLLLTIPTKIGHSKLEKAGSPSWGGEIPKTRLTSHLNLYLLFFP